MVTITSPFVFLSLSLLHTPLLPSIHPSIPSRLIFCPLNKNNKDLFVPQNAVLCKHTGKEGILLHSVQPLPLDLVVEVEVALVEVVNSNVAVLSAACVALARGVGGDGVEGTEVTSHTADLVLEDLVVETGLELTLSGRGSGDVHGGLTTTEDDEVLLGGDSSAVQGSIGDVCLENLEVAGRDKLGEVSVCTLVRKQKRPTLAVLSLQAVMK